MDPNACWRRFLNCLCDGDTEEAVFALMDLREWLHKGGFPPEGVNLSAVRKLILVFTHYETAKHLGA